MSIWLVETTWFEATRLVAQQYRGDLATIRAPAPGQRSGQPPKEVWLARKLAVHLTVQAAGEAPGTVAGALGRRKGWVEAAIADVAAERAADPVFDAEVRALELRMQRWWAGRLASETPARPRVVVDREDLPACKVIRLFGVEAIAEACGLTRWAVYGWQSRQRSGHVPAAYQATIYDMARERGVPLSAEQIIGVA